MPIRTGGSADITEEDVLTQIRHRQKGQALVKDIGRKEDCGGGRYLLCEGRPGVGLDGRAAAVGERCSSPDMQDGDTQEEKDDPKVPPRRRGNNRGIHEHHLMHESPNAPATSFVFDGLTLLHSTGARSHPRFRSQVRQAFLAYENQGLRPS